MLKKIFIKTFGCQMNEYDSGRISDITNTIGYNLTDTLENADCFIINTCHIREKATEKVYHEIGRAKKYFRNKQKPILIVTGCVAQAEGSIMLERENYIDAVIGPQSYHDLPNIIKKIERDKNKIDITDFKTIEKFDTLKNFKNLNSKVSAHLSIQEGCDKFCKFCVVPYTRGPEYSRPFGEIIDEAKLLVRNGAREITLLGQNVNAYNYKNKKISHIIKEINCIKELRRIRYTTSHPIDMTDDLIEAHHTFAKLMPLLHLPVQSGSDKILKLMNRKHTIENYRNIINKLKSKKPSIKFTSDFIIAYPGETEAEFMKSIYLMKKIEFINSFSFIYSQRPGTPASNLDHVDLKIGKERLRLFQLEANKIKLKYKKSNVGKTINVLFENQMKDGKYFGRDEYCNSVLVEANENIVGQMRKVKVNDFNLNTLFGTLSQIKKDSHNQAA